MITSYRRLLIFITLIVIFAAPSLFAYLFYSHPAWLSRAPTNRGTFISSPPVLTSMDHSKHWRLVLWNPMTCDNQCMQSMDILARVRLALGRRLYQVDVYLILNTNAVELTQSQAKILQNNNSHVLRLPLDEQIDKVALGNTAAFYIVSPENAVILKYSLDSPPDDLFHDIKQLVSDK